MAGKNTQTIQPLAGILKEIQIFQYLCAVKRILSLLIFYLASVFVIKGQDRVLHSVYLIGDAGNDTLPSDALQLLAFDTFNDTASSVIFLGDNCYPQGLNPNQSPRKMAVAKRKLTAQYELLVAYRGNVSIIPGNHDWSNGKRSGKKAIIEQADLANSWFKVNSIAKNRQSDVFATKPGFPGPNQILLSEKLDLIALDSQWWLQSGLFNPVGKLPGMNREQTRKAALNQLDSVLAESSRKGHVSIVAAHHPLFSNGKHVHVNEPIRSLVNYTPFQLFGLLGLNRYFSQDLPQPRYKRYRKSMVEILKKYPHVIYVSGHEHAMEYFDIDNVRCVVSGSGSKQSELNRYRYQARFMEDNQHGYFRMSIHESGKVVLHAVGVKDRGEYWETDIFTIPTSN